ncbi:MAG: T9SS type A sorting domain-containing protein [Bacteroidia bacterium]|nr:T9SS type A sorting domain-containing protein [Bacteroidia bacterium]
MFSQFAPRVGEVGTTAIYKDSSSFKSWATDCKIIRGYQNISIPSGGYADVGDSLMALGKAGEGVVSLGDGGIAILQFNTPIKDANGPDFAVFENSFDGYFLELAFVEVSSDGINYFRFPAVSNIDTVTQTGSFAYTDPTKLNNLAGKYKAEYGTPFDLADITDNILLDKQAITHVKIIDVVGCIQNQYCTRDMNQHKINDPWPTGFGSGGFDLDAVGIINQQIVDVKEFELQNVRIYPNPAEDILYVNLPSTNYSVEVTNIIGEVVLQSENKSNTSSLHLYELNQGVYTLIINSNGKQKQIKFIKQ